MTIVPPDSFVKKSTAEELLPRSGRQLTRDISKAVARRDIEALKCFQLRMLDETIIESVDLNDIGVVKQLGLSGRGPEWYVDVELWRSILNNRAHSRSRATKSPPATNTEDQHAPKSEDESDKQESQDNKQQGNSYITELLSEKDLRIKELKDSKDYLERLLERLIGKDTLKALADIVGNESVNSTQLATLIKSTSAESNTTSDSPAKNEPPVVSNASNAVATNPDMATSNSNSKIDVIDVDATLSIDNLKQVKPTKKKPRPKKTVAKAKKQLSKGKSSKRPNRSSNKKKHAAKTAQRKKPASGIKSIWKQFFRS